MAETTPQPESTEPPQPFEETEEQKKKFDKLNTQLNLTSIGMIFAAERDAALSMDAAQAEAKINRGEAIVDFDAALKIAERKTGLTPTETVEAATFQNIPIQEMFVRITQAGEPVSDVVKSYEAKRAEVGLTPQQRRVKKRQFSIAARGIQRIEAGEKELDPQIKEQTLTRLRGMFDPEKQPPKIYTGDAALGEAEDAVIKMGQPGYNRIEKLANRITDPEIADDPERAQMLRDMLADLGPPTTGAMVREAVSDNALNEMLGKLSTYDLNKQSTDRNIKRGTKEYEDLKKTVYKNALYEATLLKTANKFFPPMFVSYDMIDPLGKFSDPASDRDTSWIKKMVDAASEVRVEVVGLDRKGSPIYRLTHPTWHVFEMADSAQAAAAGVVERLARGPEDERLVDAFAEGALEGVRNRRDFLKAAMSTEMASNSKLGAAAAGFGGFAAAILTPDLFMGAAAVARVTKKVAVAAKNVRAFKAMAPALIDELGDGAETLAKAEQIIGDGVADALSAGNYDEALRLLDEAKKFASDSDRLISQARNTSEDMVRVVDQLDQDIARRLTDEIPEMGIVEGRRLAAKIPGAFGATAENLHPSVRRVELRGSTLDQPVPFPELFNTRMSIEHLQDSIRLLKKGDINEQFLIAYVDEANKFSSSLASLMSDAKVGTQTAGLSATQRQASVDLINYLTRYESTRLLRDDPNAWASKVKRLAANLPFDPDDLAANRKFLSGLDKAITETLASTKSLKSKLKTTVTIADATEATAKATKALRGQFESRAAAMAFVREKVAKQANIEVDPLLVPLTEKHKAIGREGLSPEGLSFLRQIEIAVPGLKGDDALRIIKIEDQKARKWAKTNNSTVGKYYEEQFRLSNVVEGPPTTTKPPPTPTAPTPSPAPTPAPKPPPTAGPKPTAPTPTPKAAPTPAPPESPTQLPLPIPPVRSSTRGAFEGPVGSAPKRVELDGVAPKDSIIDGKTPLERRLEPNEVHRYDIITAQPPEPGLSPEVLFNHLQGVDDGIEALEFLLRHGELDSTRAIAKRILPVLKREFKDEKLNFKIVHGSNFRRGVRGDYSDAKGEVRIRGENIFRRTDERYPDLTSTGLSEETILHELIHAATVRYIRANPSSKEVKALESLSGEIKVVLQKLLDDTPELPLDGSAERALLAEQRKDLVRRLGKWESYYGTPVEMVSFTLTSPKFQEMLRTIKVTPKQSLWNKFTRTIANIFGIKSGDEESAFAQAIVATEDIIRASSKQFDRPLRESLFELTATRRVKNTNKFRFGASTEGLNNGNFIEVEIFAPKQGRLGPKEMRVRGIELSDDVKNTGLGTEIYIRALRKAQNEGAAFVSDVGPSPDALRVYGSLERYGIKFRRRGVPSSKTGEISDQLFITADDLKQIDLQDVLNQHVARKTPSDAVFSMVPNVASNRVVVERLDDGRIFLRALTDTATADDFIRALGSASRRNLDESDMKALVAWLGTKGVKVSHNGAVFTAKDPATIERAEDEFASAYLTYVRSGRADKPEIKGALNKASEWLKDTYAAATGRSVGGPPPGMDPTLTKTLDKMLRRPSDQVSLPNIFKITKDALFSTSVKGTEIDVGQEILRVTYRLGYPMAEDDLQKQMTKAAKLYSEGKKDQAVIKLPGPVSFGGRPAKDEYSLDEIIKIQSELESAKLLDMSDTSLLPLGGAHRGVGERNASEIVEQIVHGSRAGGVFKSLYLGGDAYADMRSLPLIVREAIQGGARKVQQAVGETITLVTEKDVTNLMHYLTGKAAIQFAKGGRSAVSAGHDSMGDVVDSLRKYFEAVASTPEGERKLEIVSDFCQLVRERGSSAKAITEIKNRGYDQEELMAAFSEIVRGKKANRFLRETFQAAGFKADDEARLLPEYFTQARYGSSGTQDAGGLLETMLYYADRVPREYKGKGQLFSERLAAEGMDAQRSEATFLRLYEDLNTVFKDDSNVSNRVAILIAAHGHANKAKMEWVGMGIAADEKLNKSINRYFLGEFVADEDIAQVKRFFENMGYNPNMVEAFDLYGQKMFIPAQARKRLSMALDQAMDPAIRKQVGGDLWDALAEPENIIRAGVSGKNESAKMTAALFYRYLKTRMVRGHYILKAKYFWMNTFDHFNQTALRCGYSTALVSTTRMVSQNLLSNNIGQAFVAAARMMGRGQSVEDVRRVLQSFGDEGAKWAGKLTRSSKWHISVNDVLRGGDTIIMVGGRPYKANDLRQQFLEAGIFASFDTSQLGTKIQNVGNLFLDEVAKSTSGKTRKMFKDIKDDIKGASEDIAEAWSERERLGLAITLMEKGLDPRTAARLTIDALYDYAGSMSKGDRNFLLNLFFPFWAFQKNANRHIFDTIFSPEGAYRLGVMRRFHDKGSDVASELAYLASVDENGVDVDALPPDLRQSYFALKKQVYERLSVDGQVPPLVRHELRMFISGSLYGYHGGQLLESTTPLSDEISAIADDLRDEKTGERLPIDRRALASYYVPRTDRSSLPGYYRDRISLRFPYTPSDYEETVRDPAVPGEFNDTMKTWLDLYRARNVDAPYVGLFIPEATYVAAFNHMTYLTSSMIMTMQKIEDMGDSWWSDEDDGSDAINPYTGLLALATPERAPILSDLLAELGLGGNQVPRKMAFAMVYTAQMFNMDILEIDEKDDPFDVLGKAQQAKDEGEEFELPLLGTDKKIKPGMRYYLMPGVAQAAFVNSPFGEMNDLLLKLERTAPEKAAGLQGRLQQVARGLTGLEIKDVSRSKSAAQEMFRARKETPQKVIKKAQSREKLK